MSNEHPSVLIAGRKIGKSHKPYIIAEMSGNHNGDIERAYKIIDAAKEAGADAVKIQTYTPDTITIDHDGPEFFIEEGLWKGRRLYELYDEAHTPWDWHEKIINHGKKVGITIFSSPFDSTAIDMLEDLNVPAYKIASPELIDHELIKKVSATGKPVILSTGMATLIEIEEAIEAARSTGCKDIVVLHCTSAYPTPIEESNLSTIKDIEKKFDLVTGLSDHTMGTAVSTISIAMGASVIEKHFTLDRNEGGVDSNFSLEPKELKQLVIDTNMAWVAIGNPCYTPTKSESSVLKNRRSLYVVKNIKSGEDITRKNIRSIRPGNGMHPKFIDSIIGMKASRDLKFGEPLDDSMIERK